MIPFCDFCSDYADIRCPSCESFFCAGEAKDPEQCPICGLLWATPVRA